MASGLRWTEEQLNEFRKTAPVKTYPLRVIAGDKLTLPFPPTLNHMHRSKGKQHYLSAEYKAFIGMVDLAVHRSGMPKFGAKRLAIAITLHGPNKRRFDIDNRIKAACDALQRAGLFDDDSQIDHLTVTRGEIVKSGLCEVTIQEA